MADEPDSKRQRTVEDLVAHIGQQEIKVQDPLQTAVKSFLAEVNLLVPVTRAG